MGTPHDPRDHELGELRRDVDELREEIEAASASIIDIAGKNGNNGKLGALRERVDKGESRRWWVVTFLVGNVLLVLGTAIAFGRWMGGVDSSLENLKQRRSHSQPPAVEPARKDTPP